MSYTSPSRPANVLGQEDAPGSASDSLGLSTETVLRPWRRGEIPGGTRLASNVLWFREAAIDGWLAELECVDEVRTEAHTASVRD